MSELTHSPFDTREESIVQIQPSLYDKVRVIIGHYAMRRLDKHETAVALCDLIQKERQMSTNDVPGAVAANRDVLAAGAWAEHQDGSKIFVKGTEGGRVVFEMFNVQKKISYTHIMDEVRFKTKFSWSPGDGPSKDRWTWHDKTPFDWDTVMDEYQTGPQYASAAAQMSAADRVAEDLGIKGEKLTAERIREIGRGIIDTIADAMEKFRR